MRMTQQNKNLRRLLESSNILVERAPDAILRVGSDGQICRVNETACKLFYFAAEELIGRKFTL